MQFEFKTVYHESGSKASSFEAGKQKDSKKDSEKIRHLLYRRQKKVTVIRKHNDNLIVRQKISKFKNITFYNDSKATNACSAKIALSCLENIYWLTGGRSKKGGLHGIGGKELKNVRKIFTYGEASLEFKEHLVDMKSTEAFLSLDDALKSAFMNAMKEKININITLSPACSASLPI